MVGVRHEDHRAKGEVPVGRVDFGAASGTGEMERRRGRRLPLSVFARLAHGIASRPQDARWVRQGRSDLQDSS